MNKENYNNFCINEFQIPNTVYDQGKSFGMFLIVGQKECGKTPMIKQIMTSFMKKNIIENTIIFCHDSNNRPNAMMRYKEDYNNIVTNPDNIYDKLEEKHLKKIIKMQCKKNSKPLLLIFDDVVSNKTILFPSFFDIVINGAHHFKITLIMAMQYPFILPLEIRTNFDYICAFKNKTEFYKRRLYDDYFCMLPTYSAFNSIISQLPPHTCLVATNIYSFNLKKQLTYFKIKVMINNGSNKIPVMKFLNNKNNQHDIIELINVNNNIIGELQNKNNKLLKKLKL